MLGWLFAILALLVGAFWALSGRSPESGGLESGAIVYALLLGALALLFLASLRLDYRGRATKALSHALIWIGLGLALISAYAYRDEIEIFATRVASEVVPAGRPIEMSETESGERSVRLRKQENGHFVAQAEVNGVAMRLMVDTGASTVVLRTTDAELVGIDTSALSFSVPVQTANGTTYAAPARLRSIAIGPIALDGVEALVAQPGTLKESLLGMSFLKRLRSYEFSGDFLTIRG